MPPFPNQFLLDQHTQMYHRGGYPEAQQMTITDKGKPELKALEHSLAAMRDKIQKANPQAMPIPISATKPREQITSLPRGWVKKSDNQYVFDQEIHRNNTPFQTTVITVSAELNPRHGTITEHRYERDLTELQREKDKDTVLESRLSALTTSDPKFHQISTELYKTKDRIAKLSRDIKPDAYHTLVLEDYYRFDIGTNENTEWMKQFMDKTLSECQRLTENHKKIQPIA
ncbi:MAG: hypothetical protein WC623_21695 [Pedobacter sp.]|uniref:hypothetical protein n=1 Tax=Pedobacter sp. TaxID=1411316 RepID=UPI0035663907